MNYKYIGEYVDGLAMVRSEEGLWGFIDRDMNLIVPCKYENFNIDDKTFAINDGSSYTRKLEL